jgi:hypothetical protein
VVSSPTAVLLSLKVANVVLAGAHAAELGPIGFLRGPSHINGRAGLYPGRYQSDETDLTDGPMVGGHHRRLRNSMMRMADKLILYNDLFSVSGGLKVPSSCLICSSGPRGHHHPGQRRQPA